MELIIRFIIDFYYTYVSLYNLLLCFAITIIINLIHRIITIYQLKTQDYITSNSIFLITGGSLGLGRELIDHLLTKYKCTIINIDVRDSEFPNLSKD